MSADQGATGLERSVGRALARWVAAVVALRGSVLTAAALLFGLSLFYTTQQLGIQSDKKSLFPDDLPFRVLESRYFDAFPQMREIIVIVVEGRTAESTRTAAHRLAEALEADAENFEDVYLPAHPFFETNGLLYLDIDELEDIVDRLARMQPMLASVIRDPTLPGLIAPLRRALEAVREGDVEAFELAPVLDRIARTLADAEAGRMRSLDWSQIVTWGDGDQNLLRQVIYATPHLDFASMAAAEGAIHALQAHSARLGIGDDDASTRLRMTGDMVLNFEEMTLLRTQVRVAGFASFAIVAALLFAALRSTRLVVATVCSLLFGLVATAAFAALAIGHLNMISVAFAVLFIGLGVDFGIHLCMRFQELMRTKRGVDPALLETTRGVGSSLVLCAATTSIGFFAFVPTDFIGVAELGLIAGVGMFIGLASSFTILPAMIAGATQVTERRLGPAARAALPNWPSRHPRAVTGGAIALALLGSFAVSQIRFDQSPLGVRDPAADSVAVYEELLAEPGASPWSLNYLAATEAEAKHMERRFEALADVDGARTIWDYVPEDQALKLAIIEEMNLFADWTSIESKAGPVSTADRRAALEALREEIDRLDAAAVSPDVERAAALLRARLVRLGEELDGLAPAEVDAKLLDLEARLLERFEDPLDRLERALDARAFGVEDLPRAITRRMISDQGWLRVEILPVEDLTDNDALDRFVASVRSVSPDVAGPAVSIHDSARAVVRALRQAFGAALVTILGILIVLWRRLGDVLLVMLPLGWAGLTTGLAMYAFDIDFNFADVIVLPLLLGIGVDSGIHMVHRARIESRTGDTILSTSTARAVVFSAATTIASFGSLALVPHRGMASLGQLLVVGVACTVVANLVLLPALLTLRPPARDARS